MKSIIMYYSYRGHTKKVAEKMAHTLESDLLEVQTPKRKNIISTFFVDCPRARMRKSTTIKPIESALDAYDLITLAVPVWAGFPAPAFNAMVNLLPSHKNIQLVFVSSSGTGATKKSEEGTRKLIKKHGCSVVDYKEIRAQA